MNNKNLNNNAPVVILTTVTSATTKKNVDVEASKIQWTGKKIAGTHAGTIKLKEGHLNLTEDGKLAGGQFTMDMNTIVVTDLTGEGKEQLEGHLNSEDFFGVENHPTSTFVITEATPKTGNTYTVKGDLTIKAHTEPEVFELEVTENSASGVIKIDRTKFGIRYGSGKFFDNLGDAAINNNFTLDVNLKF